MPRLDCLAGSPVEDLRGFVEDLAFEGETVDDFEEAFDAAGVHPDDCRELADLAKFPTTTKADSGKPLARTSSTLSPNGITSSAGD